MQNDIQLLCFKPSGALPGAASGGAKGILRPAWSPRQRKEYGNDAKDRKIKQVKLEAAGRETIAPGKKGQPWGPKPGQSAVFLPVLSVLGNPNPSPEVTKPAPDQTAGHWWN